LNVITSSFIISINFM